MKKFNIVLGVAGLALSAQAVSAQSTMGSGQSTSQGTAGQSTTNHNGMNHGTMDQSAAGQGTMGQSAAGQGTMGQGATGQGTMGQGAVGQNTMSQGMQSGAMMPGMEAAMTTATAFVPMAASSDQFEIQSSQLALQASQNQAVRNYANLMIAHHSYTTQQLTTAAASAGLAPPPPTLMPMHQQMLDQLRAAGSGAAFDAAYKQAQVMSHTATLQLMNGYANSGDVPALRQVAGATAPIVQQHLQQAELLRTDMMSGQQGKTGQSGMNGTNATTEPTSGRSSDGASRAGERG